MTNIEKLLKNHKNLIMVTCDCTIKYIQSERRMKYFRGTTIEELKEFAKEAAEKYNCDLTLEINEKFGKILSEDDYDELYDYLEELSDRIF